MISRFFYSTFGPDAGDFYLTLFTVLVICLVCLIPFFIPVFRNAYYIDKMNKKNKRKQKNDFDRQLAKLVGDTKDAEIESLKAEIERLKKEKK
ncbi:MAG: hypothetical protein J6P07_01310 [Spirochaetaceae bacterium]|nr:hypothetical protein [Spirochaetaceae bacterium]MBO7731874.1 hypothetical protein [Methanobrevibacter sp.]